MTNDKTVNVEKITSANKIKLVVTDADQADASMQSVTPAAAVSLEPESDVKLESNVNRESSANPHISAEQESNADQQSNIEQENNAHVHEIADADKVMRELPVDEFFQVLERATPEQLQALIHTFEKGARTRGGTAILRRVIEVPKGHRSMMSIVAWWEWRRPLYNLVVGLSGVPSVLVLWLIFGVPLMVVVMSGLAYLFLANICYTLGTPAEIVARTCYKEKAETYGPVLLTLGTIFSVVLTIALEIVVLGLMCLGTFRVF